MKIQINKINTQNLMKAIDDKLVAEVEKITTHIGMLHVYHTGKVFESEECPCLSCAVRSMIDLDTPKDAFPEIYNSLQIAVHNCKSIIIDEYNKLPKVPGEDPCQVLWMLLNPLFDNRQLHTGNTFVVMNIIDDLMGKDLPYSKGIQEYFNVLVASEFAYGGLSRMVFGNSESSELGEDVDDLIASLKASTLAQLGDDASPEDFSDAMRAALMKAKESGNMPKALRDGLDSGRITVSAVKIDMSNKPTLQ